MNKTLPPITEIWDYNNPDQTREKFEQILILATELGEEQYKLELLTQIARTYSLVGQFQQAHDTLDLVGAKMAGNDVVKVRYLLERGRTFNSANQQAAAFPLFQRAYELADTIGEGGYATDALHMLGIAAPPAQQLDWNLRAIAYAEQSDHKMARKWLGSLYNNTGWSYVNLGEYEAALELFQRALKVRENDGTPEQINVAKYCVAKVFRLLGQPTKSLVIQESLRNKDNLDGFTEEEIGECLLALGKPAQAKSFFRIAYDILSKIGWVADDEQRMARLREFVA